MIAQLLWNWESWILSVFSGPVSNNDLFDSLMSDSPLKPASKSTKSRDTYKFEPSVDSLEGSDDEYNPSTSKKGAKGKFDSSL